MIYLDRGPISEWLRGYNGTERFIALLHSQGYRAPTIIDLNILTQALLALSSTLTRLLDAYGWTGPLAAKLRICGVWRTISFIDADFVLNEYDAHGMPLSLNNEQWIHRGREANSFLNILGLEDGDGSYVTIAMRLLVPIALTLGIPIGSDPDAEFSPFGDLIDAGNRARQVQLLRSQTD